MNNPYETRDQYEATYLYLVNGYTKPYVRDNGIVETRKRGGGSNEVWFIFPAGDDQKARLHEWYSQSIKIGDWIDAWEDIKAIIRDNLKRPL